MRFFAWIYSDLVTRRVFFALGWSALAIGLSSCGIGGLSPIFPNPVSPNGRDIYDTYIGISVPAIFIFVLVEFLLLWVIFRYRRSVQPPGYVPPQVHGHVPLEIVWTVIPLFIVLAIAGYSFNELVKDFQPVQNEQMDVIISGHQFGWTYDYQQLNGQPLNVKVDQEGTLAGEVTPFVVPTNTLVKLRLRGTDVIHSWWVPAISGKTDAVPGYDNFAWMKIDQVGKWRGECAELCGAGHATMQIVVQAMDMPDFMNWVDQQKASQASPSPSPST